MTLQPVAADLCLLCKNGMSELQFPYAVVKSDGTTCTHLAMDLAQDFQDGTEACSEQLEAWRPICCGDQEPIEVKVTESRFFDTYPDIDSIETVGPNPKCNLCRDGDYPSAHSMVIHMLYIGAASCPQYWKAGQQGYIPNHLCAPLQYFAYEPCGCGEISTNGNYNWEQPYDGESTTTTTTTTNNNNNNQGHDDDDAWWSGADSVGGGGGSSNNIIDKEDDDDRWWLGADSLGGDSQDSNWWMDADSNGKSSAPLPTFPFGRSAVLLWVGTILLGTATSFGLLLF